MSLPSSIHTIVTHPGGAHKDELLACALLLQAHPVEILRRDPTPEELHDPQVAVVDIGYVHDPARSNFDHHQFPRDHTPTCSLSLVLQALDLYEDAHRFCDWLETLEWFDSKGAIATARWLGIDPEVSRKLHSPLDVTLLNWFASGERWKPGDALWETLRRTGSDLVRYLKTLHDRLQFIAAHHEIWEFPHDAAESTLRMIFLPRTDPLPDDPSLGLARFMDEHSLRLHGLIYPDRRGPGYGLSRYQDDPLLDFSRITDAPDVHFAHARGFLAKTHVTDTQRLRELVAASIVAD
ncbi:MAG: MYG1 family protein [Puniceicoccaceae bacterium]